MIHLRKWLVRIVPVLVLASQPAWAQQQAAQAQSSGGGVSSGGGIRHVTSVGLGMGVGRTAGGGVVGYHGFLARAIATRDILPPVFQPALADVNFTIPAMAAACTTSVVIPRVFAVDARDANPVITVTLMTDPPQNIVQPADRMAQAAPVVLGPGSYDVIAVAVDRRNNRVQGAFRVNVTDGTTPTFSNVPNPTPVGGEAEATSPAGTVVNIAGAVCRDVCDPAPTVANNAPANARFPLGNTVVTYTCRDSAGNVAAPAMTTIRVKDTTVPRPAGGTPADFAADCNNPNGSVVRVPGIVWEDNGYSAMQLTYALVVDPAGANQQFNPMPAEVTLTGGAHILRYLATDPSGNVGIYNLRVNVADISAPRVEVVNAPQLGWYNVDANVNLRITDNCSRLQGGLAVIIDPAPQAQAINGDVMTVTYRNNGIYALSITIRDGAGNEATNNAIGFGIDRTRPGGAFAIPAQDGVVVNTQHSYPMYPFAETMPLNVSGDDPGDGRPSGVRRVQVVLDPAAGARTLSDATFNGQGNPQQGLRLQANIRCTDNRNGDAAALCNAAGEVDLRKLTVGAHVLRTTVTDFAGNTTSTDGVFVNANLRYTLGLMVPRINARIALGGLNMVSLGHLRAALPLLQRGRTMAEVELGDSPYATPRFLGGALKAVQDAATLLQLAVNASRANNPADVPVLNGYPSTILRAGRSDLVMFREHVLNLPGNLQWFDEAWEAGEFGIDVGRADDWLGALEAHIAADRWTDAANSGIEMFFSLKSAHSGWMMNYQFTPNIQEDFDTEYVRARDVLVSIREELVEYLQVAQAPALDQIRRMSDQLAVVIANLDLLIDTGFKDPNNLDGLTDEIYVEDLINLQTTANASLAAANQGAFVRNYQWAMMQVVRYMAQASVRVATLVVGQRQNFAMFRAAQARIDSGVAMLSSRRVQEAINLYGEPASTCSIVSIYHCAYLQDEGVTDIDLVRDEGDSRTDSCWNTIYRPSVWEDHAPVAGVPVACQWGNLQ